MELNEDLLPLMNFMLGRIHAIDPDSKKEIVFRGGQQVHGPAPGYRASFQWLETLMNELQREPSAQSSPPVEPTSQTSRPIADSFLEISGQSIPTTVLGWKTFRPPAQEIEVVQLQEPFSIKQGEKILGKGSPGDWVGRTRSGAMFAVSAVEMNAKMAEVEQQSIENSPKLKTVIIGVKNGKLVHAQCTEPEMVETIVIDYDANDTYVIYGEHYNIWDQGMLDAFNTIDRTKLRADWPSEDKPEVSPAAEPPIDENQKMLNQWRETIGLPSPPIPLPKITKKLIGFVGALVLGRPMKKTEIDEFKEATLELDDRTSDNLVDLIRKQFGVE